MRDDSHLVWVDMEMTGLDPQSDRIIERLEDASGLSILADGFPTVLVDDEPEEEGYEIVPVPPMASVAE